MLESRARLGKRIHRASFVLITKRTDKTYRSLTLGIRVLGEEAVAYELSITAVVDEILPQSKFKEMETKCKKGI